jgi:hypothetical protein
MTDQVGTTYYDNHGDIWWKRVELSGYVHSQRLSEDYNCPKHVAILYSMESDGEVIMHKHGNPEWVMKKYEDWKKKYQAADLDRQDIFEQQKALGLPVITGSQMAEELGVLLTDDLEEVNRSVNNSFYLGIYLRNLGITKPCVFKTNTLVIESVH